MEGEVEEANRPGLHTASSGHCSQLSTSCLRLRRASTAWVENATMLNGSWEMLPATATITHLAAHEGLPGSAWTKPRRSCRGTC